MRVITDHLAAGPAVKFMDFWRIVKEKTQTEPPHKGAMDRLNGLRVNFKHKGNLPNPSVVADLMPSVAAFCAESAEQYLEVKFESASLADLIQNAQAREKVKEAERVNAEGKIPDALLALGIAFDKLHDEARKKYALGLIQQSYWQRLDRHDRVMRPLQQAIDTVNMMTLGIEPARFRRFSASTPARSYSVSGNMQVTWRAHTARLGTEDFDFCHQFVIDFALRLGRSA